MGVVLDTVFPALPLPLAVILWKRVCSYFPDPSSPALSCLPLGEGPDAQQRTGRRAVVARQTQNRSEMRFFSSHACSA